MTVRKFDLAVRKMDDLESVTDFRLISFETGSTLQKVKNWAFDPKQPQRLKLYEKFISPNFVDWRYVDKKRMFEDIAKNPNTALLAEETYAHFSVKTSKLTLHSGPE